MAKAWQTGATPRVALCAVMIAISPSRRSAAVGPQELRHFFLELHQGFGPLRPRFVSGHFPFERRHLRRQRVLRLRGRSPLLGRQAPEFAHLPLRPPGLQVREVQPLPAEQGPELPGLGTGLRFPQDLELVLGREPPPGGLRHDLDLVCVGSQVRRKHAALQDIREVVEKKLAQMLANHPMRMDYYKRYQEIIADYNREKDRATVEVTFAQLVAFAASLDTEQRRAAEEGLSDDELALFDLLFKQSISKADRERLKQASKSLLQSLQGLLEPMPKWTQNSATQAEVRVLILDNLWQSLPRPPFTEDETEAVASRVYEYVWQRSASGYTLLA